MLGATEPYLHGTFQSSSVLALVKVLETPSKKPSDDVHAAEGRIYSRKIKLLKVDSCLITPYGHVSDQMHLSRLLIEK